VIKDFIAEAMEPKCDQLNASDLAGGRKKIIKITQILQGSKEQKVVIRYEGDDGKPWKPCKGMVGGMAQLWGKPLTVQETIDKWVGQSLELFNDETVVYGGVPQGGIRICGATGIPEGRNIVMKVSKGKTKTYFVRLIKAQQGKDTPVAEDALLPPPEPEINPEWQRVVDGLLGAITGITDLDGITAFMDRNERIRIAPLRIAFPSQGKLVDAALQAKQDMLKESK
jgi:hypothetical protein